MFSRSLRISLVIGGLYGYLLQSTSTNAQDFDELVKLSGQSKTYLSFSPEEQKAVKREILTSAQKSFDSKTSTFTEFKQKKNWTTQGIPSDRSDLSREIPAQYLHAFAEGASVSDLPPDMQMAYKQAPLKGRIASEVGSAIIKMKSKKDKE